MATALFVECTKCVKWLNKKIKIKSLEFHFQLVSCAFNEFATSIYIIPWLHYPKFYIWHFLGKGVLWLYMIRACETCHIYNINYNLKLKEKKNFSSKHCHVIISSPIDVHVILPSFSLSLSHLSPFHLPLTSSSPTPPPPLTSPSPSTLHLRIIYLWSLICPSKSFTCEGRSADVI